MGRKIETCARHIAVPVRHGHLYRQEGYCLGRYTDQEGLPCDDHGNVLREWPVEAVPVVDLTATITLLTEHAQALRATAALIDQLALMLHQGPPTSS